MLTKLFYQTIKLLIIMYSLQLCIQNYWMFHPQFFGYFVMLPNSFSFCPNVWIQRIIVCLWIQTYNTFCIVCLDSKHTMHELFTITIFTISGKEEIGMHISWEIFYGKSWCLFMQCKMINKYDHYHSKKMYFSTLFNINTDCPCMSLTLCVRNLLGNNL